MTRFFIPAASTALFVCLQAPAFAADASVPEVEEVVVTLRLPGPVETAPSARVVTRAEIEDRGHVDAFDALTELPGVHLSRNGGFGGATTLRLRGATSDKALVLVDGVPVNDASAPAGGYDFSTLDLFDVDRIEVLSGPQGSLWGSDAIGGVVNVVTRPPEGTRAFVEAGAYETLRGGLAVGRRDEAGALGLTLSGLTTEGISKADARDGNTERDGFDLFTAALRGERRLTDRVTVEGGLRYADSRVEYDGFSFASPTGVADGPEASEQTSWSGFASLGFQAAGFEQALRLDGYRLERADFGPYPFAAEADRLALRWTATRTVQGVGEVLVGLEREETSADTGAGRETSDANAAFAIWRARPAPGLTTTLSVRVDDPDRYEGETTARAAFVWQAGGGVWLAGAAGQGFKTPSIFQSTWPCGFCSPAGPARGLKPERAQGYELTLGWRGARAEGSVTAYRLEVEDQIDFGFPGGYANLDRTRSDGVEAEGRVTLAPGLTARAAYAWTDAIDRTTGARLLKVPEHSGSAGIDWRGERARASLSVRAKGERADVYGRTDGYVVADLAGGWRLTDRVEVTLRVENLTDEAYQEALGYGEPGRSAYAGLKLGW